MAMLFVVATPIGNLKDITLRALEVLESCDGIICEDSRRTSILLQHYNISYSHSREGSPREAGGNPIKIPLLVLNDYNESKMINSIISQLKSGHNLALVSDAGTPLISDPGYKLVRECLNQGIEVDSLPGPSSVTAALTLSGLPPDKFMFLGYPPEKRGKRMKWLEDFKKNDATIIMFVSPHKLLKTLEDMKEVFGDIEIVLAHELTKIHQSVEKKAIGNWLETLKNPKGEYILLLNLS